MLITENKIRKIVKKIILQEIKAKKTKKEKKEKIEKKDKVELPKEKERYDKTQSIDDIAEEIGDYFDSTRLLKKSKFDEGFFFGMSNKDGINFGKVNKSSGPKYENQHGVSVKNIKVALAYLWPFLPKNSRITSIGRLQKDQDAIIKSYAKKHDIEYVDSYAGLTNALTKLKALGLKIARSVGEGHGGKNNTIAFDIRSGKGTSDSALKDLKIRIQKFNKVYGEHLFKFREFGIKNGSLVETAKSQRIVHAVVDFNTMRPNLEYDPKELIPNLQKGKKSGKAVKTNIRMSGETRIKI